MAVSYKNPSLFLMVFITLACLVKHTEAQQTMLPTKSPCLHAVDVALDDPHVFDLFLDRIQTETCVLNDIVCLPYSGPENFHYIHFDFDCVPGIYCILDPGFLVVVDARRNLVKIADQWYSPSQSSLNRMLRILDTTDEMRRDD